MGSINAKTSRQQCRPGCQPRWPSGHGNSAEQHPISPISAIGYHIHAVVHAIGEIHIPIAWWAKKRFIAWAAAAKPVTGGLALAIRLRFHNHAPQKLARGLALQQQAADQLGGDDLGGAGEEGLGEAQIPGAQSGIRPVLSADPTPAPLDQLR